MDQPQPDTEKLSIRCPGCGQRFKVGQELRDRVVECGSCEHRFRVNDEVLVRAKKFYPGERKSGALDSFSRVPKSLPASSAVFQPVQYAENPGFRPPEPASPLRVFLGFSAVAIAVIMALLLASGGTPGGMLEGTTQSKRVILAVFSAVFSGALLVAANPGARGRAVAGALAVAAALISVPFVFKSDLVSAKSSAAGDEISDPVVRDEREDALEAFKKELSYDPVERALLADPRSVGLWLRGLKDYNRPQISSYIVRNSGASEAPPMYPRSDGYLMVLSGVQEDMSELMRLCGRFGKIGRASEDLRVIEVEVDNASFQQGPLDKLTDPGNPAFYELNRRELESIDLKRALEAVKRLSPAEPKYYRKDISTRMLELLEEGDFELKGEIGKALAKWSEPGDGSEEKVLEILGEIPAGGEVPQPLVVFLVGRKNEKVIPLVERLWAADPTRWESSFGELGQGIESRLLEGFAQANVSQRMSSVRLLAKVGTSRSVPVLQQALASADSELKVMIERALDSIRERR